MNSQDVSQVSGQVFSVPGVGLSAAGSVVSFGGGQSRLLSFLEDEADEFALMAIRVAAASPMVRIRREDFLRSVLAPYVPDEVVDAAVRMGPAAAGVDIRVVDRVASGVINTEARRAAGLSFVAGLPGGVALLAAVPADVAQYFVHVMRVEQKLAYLYGWDSFLSDDGAVTDETVSRLIVLMGVMLGVDGAEGALRVASRQMAQQGMVKYARRRAVLQTVDQPILLAVVNFVGKKLGEEGVKKFAGKIIPVVGGVVSGGMTYASFKPAARRLRDYLRTLPAAQPGGFVG